jgi:hypothetical protein
MSASAAPHIEPALGGKDQRGVKAASRVQASPATRIEANESLTCVVHFRKFSCGLRWCPIFFGRHFEGGGLRKHVGAKVQGGRLFFKNMESLKVEVHY